MHDANFLKAENARALWHPMAHPAESRAAPPKIIVTAAGVRVTDIDGHETIDAVGGLWNVNLGFSCAPVKQAMTAQLDTLPYYAAFRGTSSDAAIALSWELARFFAPEGMARVFFTSGGSDSVEVALRLARQYHKLRGAGERTKFLSLRKGYHGTHFGGASVNGNANFRRAYEPMLPGCFHLPGPYLYRNPFGVTEAAALTDRIVAAMEEEIGFQGADTIAAFIMEPVLGAGGVIPPHPSLMPRLAEVCRRHGILMIADEVITAFGRVGAWSGSRLWGVQPDLMCTAKAITNGYFPFGACLISGPVAEVFEADRSGMGSIASGYTYSAHPVGAAAALACLAEMQRLDVPVNAAARGRQLFEGAQDLMARHEIIGDVRGGHGLMTAFEFVSDRAKKTPLDKAAMGRLFEAVYKAGVMVRVSGANMILSPALILTEADAARILAAIDEGVASL